MDGQQEEQSVQETEQTSEQTVDQSTESDDTKKAERVDELDVIGGMFINAVKSGFSKVKQFVSHSKTT